MEYQAVISDCGQYRYSLGRVWIPARPRILFVMLNPSTADATRNDPTLRRCIRFADVHGYGSLTVVNLFAYRSSKPQQLKKVADPIGPENDKYIIEAANLCNRTVVAWGASGGFLNRDTEVLRLLNAYGPVSCLGKTEDGRHPRHPLYLKKTTTFQRFY